MTTLWHNVFWIVCVLACMNIQVIQIYLLKYSNYIHLARMKCINFL